VGFLLKLVEVGEGDVCRVSRLLGQVRLLSHEFPRDELPLLVGMPLRLIDEYLTLIDEYLTLIDEHGLAHKATPMQCHRDPSHTNQAIK